MGLERISWTSTGAFSKLATDGLKVAQGERGSA